MSVRSTNQRHGAMTLVELLVAIAIIAILATLLIGVASAAGTTARVAKTKSMVGRLHTLLMERYDLYRTRRVDVPSVPDSVDLRALLASHASFDQITNQTIYPIGDPRITAHIRLAALRELVKVEMPDRWSDIVGWDDTNGNTSDSSPGDSVQPPAVSFAEVRSRLDFLSSVPSVTSIYLRAYNRVVADPTVTGERLRENQGAECLYLVIMNATGDGEARGLFKEADVGDTDGDGAPEFLDGWGQPITYVRWAAGFESDAQLSVPGLQNLYRRAERATNDNGLTGLAAASNALVADHDPYDLFRVDNAPVGLAGFNTTSDSLSLRGWRLAPLIASPGRDGELGFNRYEARTVQADPWLDADLAEGGPQRLGELDDAEATADNIHNHQLGTFTRTSGA